MKNKTIELNNTEGGIEKKVTFSPKRLEILIYGEKKDNDKIKKMTDSLQKQIDKHSNYVRALFYVDNGELSTEQKKEWLIKESCCKYYIFAPEIYKINDKYVETLVAKIKEAEFRLNSLRSAGVVRKKQPNGETTNKAQEPAKVISIVPEASKAE